MNDTYYELIKINLRALGKFSTFDTLKIYESDTHYEVFTFSIKEKFYTKTKIGKCYWRITECIYTKQGEQTIKLK